MATRSTGTGIALWLTAALLAALPDAACAADPTPALKDPPAAVKVVPAQPAPPQTRCMPDHWTGRDGLWVWCRSPYAETRRS